MRTRSGTGRHAGKGSTLLGALACCLALPVSAQVQPTVEQLLQRLEALERRVGEATPAIADVQGEGAPSTLGDLDQRLRVLERRLELQQEEAAAKEAEASGNNDSAACERLSHGRSLMWRCRGSGPKHLLRADLT